MFADQHEGNFPPVQDSNETPLRVRTALEPYSGTKDVFVCLRDPVKPRPPGGSYDWRFTDDPNASLAKISLDQIPRPGLLTLGGDRHPSWHKAHTINVLFGDLHVEQVTEDDWFKGLKSPIR
jgi:prepilin-type processing-associated H-X9-DG protein